MRLIRRLLLVIVLLLLVGVLAVTLFLDPLVKTSVEAAGTHAMGVDTSLESLNLGVTSGELRMKTFKVANPEGFDTEHFMMLGDGQVELMLSSLLTDTVQVPLIELKQIDMNLEKKGGHTNFQTILDNLSKLGGPKDEKDPPSEEEPGKGFVIEQLLITDVSVRTRYAGKTVTIPIRKIELEGVGSNTDHGVLLPELTGVVLQVILDAVVKNAGNILDAEIMRGLEDGLAQVGDFRKYSEVLLYPVEGVTEKLDKAVKAVGEGAGAVQDAADKAVEAFGDVLGGKTEG